MSEVSIDDFRRYVNGNFQLEARAGKMRDTARKKPVISAAQIFLGMVFGVVFGVRSLLQLDHRLRNKAVKRLLGSQRKRVASDCTYWRVLPAFEQSELKKVLQLLYRKAKAEGWLSWKEQGLPEVRLGLVDGSMFRAHGAVCFQVLGPQGALFLELKRNPKRGQELPTAKELIQELVENLGRGFVNLLLVDGLYASRDFIRECLKAGIDVLIKNPSGELTLLQDAQGLFSQSEEFRDGIAYEEGEDVHRHVRYRTWAAGGFRWEGVPAEFTVAKVWEQGLPRTRGQFKNRPGPEQVFWVLTTRGGLPAHWLRELGHQRWAIENRGFKALNALAHSKHTWAKDPAAFEAQMRMRMIAFNLMGLYRARREDASLGPAYEGVRRTMRLYSQLLYESLLLAFREPEGSAEG